MQHIAMYNTWCILCKSPIRNTQQAPFHSCCISRVVGTEEMTAPIVVATLLALGWDRCAIVATTHDLWTGGAHETKRLMEAHGIRTFFHIIKSVSSGGKVSQLFELLPCLEKLTSCHTDVSSIAAIFILMHVQPHALLYHLNLTVLVELLVYYI